MTPEHSGPEPLWLDMHLAGRLREYLPAGSEAHEGLLPPRPFLLLALRQWQARKLRENLLHAAANSLGYRKKLSSTVQMDMLLALEDISAQGTDPSIPPEDRAQAIGSALSKALSRLPFTTPEELAAMPESFLAISHSDVSGIISLPTSGTTTGQGKRVFCSDDDLRVTAEFFQHGMQYMVLPERQDHVALLMSGGRPGSVGSLLMRAMRGLGVQCSVPGFVPFTPKGEDAIVQHLIDIAPTCLVGVPGQILLLARHPRAGELGRSLHSVLLSGDSVTPVTRRAIAQGLGVEVFVHYGLTETGLGGAVECREHKGCHMREADLLHEVVDEQGRPVEPGDWGEIVITTLTRAAMPLLRYRTGDEGRIFPGECACGSILGRVQVRGRMSQRLLLPDGSILRITDLDRALYSLPYVQSYTPVLQGEGASLRLKILLRAAEGVGDEALFEAERALGALPGLRLCTAADVPQCLERLPVLLVIERNQPVIGKHMQPLRQGQAKQSFVREGLQSQ